METLLLIFLVIVDFGLLIYVYFLSKSRAESPEFLKEMATERKIVEELRASLKDQALESQNEIKKLTEKVTVLVTEAEMEYEKIKNVLDASTSDLIKEIERKLDDPVAYITKKCDVVQHNLDAISKEKDALLLALKKAETLSKFFNEKLSYEDLLEEIEDKKYVDARHLLSKGVSPKDISAQLNIPQSEVELLISMG